MVRLSLVDKMALAQGLKEAREAQSRAGAWEWAVRQGTASSEPCVGYSVYSMWQISRRPVRGGCKKSR